VSRNGCDAWPIVWPCPITGVDPALLASAKALAEQLLWSMSGYRVGVCTYREAFRLQATGACVAPYKDSRGYWHNGVQTDGMCCKVLLTHRPVEAIVEVIDGGWPLFPDQYALEGSWLRRRWGCWGSAFPCDDPQLIVTYRAGVPLPVGTDLAVGEVACEYLTALQGQPCRLPSRATSITRQGVTVTLDSASEFLNRRRIGLPITDGWLESVAGAGPRVASQVYSPDLPRGFRV
jgi:hypothetical protein